VLLGKERGMSVTQSSRGSASGYQVVYRSREFRTLRRRFASFVVPVTVLGDVNIGPCFGVLEFVSTFAITLGCNRWSRRKLDPLAGQLRQRLDSGRVR
jgi:uncharacterized membrane protein (DUF485 family)